MRSRVPFRAKCEQYMQRVPISLVNSIRFSNRYQSLRNRRWEFFCQHVPPARDFPCTRYCEFWCRPKLLQEEHISIHTFDVTLFIKPYGCATGCDGQMSRRYQVLQRKALVPNRVESADLIAYVCPTYVRVEDM
jgi:hypothetical protein